MKIIINIEEQKIKDAIKEKYVPEVCDITKYPAVYHFINNSSDIAFNIQSSIRKEIDNQAVQGLTAQNKILDILKSHIHFDTKLQENIIYECAVKNIAKEINKHNQTLENLTEEQGKTILLLGEEVNKLVDEVHYLEDELDKSLD